MKNRALLWMSQDLRFHDNEILNWAIENNCEVVVIGFLSPESSNLRKSFFIHSFLEFQSKLKEKGVSCFISSGRPEDEIPQWVLSNHISVLLTQTAFNFKIESQIKKIQDELPQIQLITFPHQCLLNPTDLPFSISQLPLVFTQFRKAVENTVSIKQPKILSESKICGFTTQIPQSSKILNLSEIAKKVEAFPFELQPGESAALEKLVDYIWKTDSLRTYKETRNGLLNKNDSSKFSVALAYGCLSAKMIYKNIKMYEEKFGENESTQWFIQELLWRDYFKFLSLKIQDQLFHPQGLSQKVKTWSHDKTEFALWCDGRTGVDFVDANMIELNRTGWMSNRGRQNVASYLAKTLQINWIWGAEYFARHLLDYDIESNWGNWLYLAGVGTDPRDRTFNIQRQAEMYDPDRSYQNKWLQIGKKN